MTPQIFKLLLVAILLTGCEDRESIAELRAHVAVLQDQKADLKRKLVEQQGEKLAQIERYEKAAAIAQGCDLIVPICPPSITGLGHAAIKAGFDGGGSIWFWIAGIGKLLLLGSLVGSFITALMLGWTRLTAPAMAEVEDACKTIAEAEKRVAYYEDRAHKARSKLEETERQVQIFAEELERLTLAVDKQQEALIAAKDEMLQVKKLRSAMSGLKL